MSETTNKRPRGRPRSFDPELALERALWVFWKQGYEGTSFADLTEAMGINAPSIVAAFGSKAELYRQVLTHYSEKYGAGIRRAIAESSTAHEAIERVLQESARLFAGSATPAGCMISTATLACAPENRIASEEAAGRRKRTLTLIESLFRSAVERGEIPPETDLPALARFYGAVIQGMSVQAIDGATEDELLALADRAMAAWPTSGT